MAELKAGNEKLIAETKKTTSTTIIINLYEKLNIVCQPVAINSGFVWPKEGLKISNKTITISILKPISAGLSKERFINTLENEIYSELDILD